MDLTLVYNEFEAYYEMKFDKKPKMVRKVDEATGNSKLPRPPNLGGGSSTSSSSSAGKKLARAGGTSNEGKLPNIVGSSGGPPSTDDSKDGCGVGPSFGIQGSSVSSSSGVVVSKCEETEKLEAR